MIYIADVKEQQKALLMQVMQLTDEQINALAPEHRDQIRQLVSGYHSFNSLLSLHVSFAPFLSLESTIGHVPTSPMKIVAIVLYHG